MFEEVSVRSHTNFSRRHRASVGRRAVDFTINQCAGLCIWTAFLAHYHLDFRSTGVVVARSTLGYSK